MHGLHIQLRGDLGAGKTAFVRAVLRGLGHTGRVRSPTYTLVEPYTLIAGTTPLDIYHFDLYRFTDPAEWIDSGFDEYLDAGALCFIEWPERAAASLGAPDLAMAFDILGEGRRLIACAYSYSGQYCLERC